MSPLRLRPRWPLLLGALLGCSSPIQSGTESTSNLESSCAPSPLFTQIASRARDAAGAGFVPASLLTTGKNTTRPEVLIGGAPIFDAVADLVASAEHEVELQTWRWDVGSDPSVRVLQGLKRLEARRREKGATTPVVVRLLVNRVAPQLSDVVTRIYRQIAEQALDPKLVDVQLVDFLASGLGANHAKTLVVDGTNAMVMGANVTNDYGKDPDMWDAGFRMTGEVAQAIHSDFAKMWSTGQLWLCGTEMEQRSNNQDGPTQPSCWGKPVPATASALVAPDSCTPMLVASHPQDGDLFPRSHNDNPQAQVFLSAVEFAKSEIRIQSPNLNEDAIKKAIVAAARRGVTVQVILSKKFEETGESLPGRGGGNEATVAELYAKLADLPNACDKLRVHWYSKDGTSAVEGTRPPASHVKYMSIDGQVVVVGSANQDVQSWRNSHELNVAVDSANITRAWDANLFGKAWDRSVVVDECKR